MRVTVAIAATVLLAGCVRQLDSNFTPIGEGKYSMAVPVTAFGPYPSSPEAEKMRLRWLDDWMTKNHACSKGYRVTNRQVTDEGLYGQVNYVAECNT